MGRRAGWQDLVRGWVPGPLLGLVRRFRDWRRRDATGAAAGSGGPGLCLVIEQFSFFVGLLILRGSVTGVRRIAGVALEVAGERISTSYDRSSGGFAFHGMIGFDERSFRTPQLVVGYADGGEERIGDIAGPALRAEAGHRLFNTFLDRVRAAPAGDLLEIGSRARSGNTRRALVPAGWTYVGMDIVAGENVDAVGDAHVLSGQFARGRFGAVMSFSVFEHLAMPWKVVLELNKVMALHGLAYIQTHQSFPLHEAPWDFWRFSVSAWPALFNAASGFRIVETGSGEPLLMVARRWHPVVNYGQAEGYAVSAVLVEKIGETALAWDVDLAEVAAGGYPIEAGKSAGALPSAGAAAEALALPGLIG